MNLFIDDPTPDDSQPRRTLLGVVPGCACNDPDKAEAPTTGAPHDYEFPEGCVCHIRDDIDRGEMFVAPPDGCQVHTPWAFPGYSLTGAEDEVITEAMAIEATSLEGVGPCGPASCECRGTP